MSIKVTTKKSRSLLLAGESLYHSASCRHDRPEMWCSGQLTGWAHANKSDNGFFSHPKSETFFFFFFYIQRSLVYHHSTRGNRLSLFTDCGVYPFRHEVLVNEAVQKETKIVFVCQEGGWGIGKGFKKKIKRNIKCTQTNKGQKGRKTTINKLKKGYNTGAIWVKRRKKGKEGGRIHERRRNKIRDKRIFQKVIFQQKWEVIESIFKNANRKKGKIKKTERERRRGQIDWLIDWLILTAHLPVWDYFMPKG